MLFSRKQRLWWVLNFWPAVSVVPSPSTEIKCPDRFPFACPRGHLIYHDFEDIAQHHCDSPSLVWRRLVFQETFDAICHGDCETVALSTPLRRINPASGFPVDDDDDSTDNNCDAILCRRIVSVIQESCLDDGPSVMDAYDVAYRVSYTTSRPPRHHRRLGQIQFDEETNGCNDTNYYSTPYYPIGLGIFSGLITFAALLWLYILYTHLERRRIRLRAAMRMLHQAETVSSKTSIVSSSSDDDDESSLRRHQGPPVPPELYATAADRSDPRMVRRHIVEPPPPIRQQHSVSERLDDISVNERVVVISAATTAESDGAEGSHKPSSSELVNSSAGSSSPRCITVIDVTEDLTACEEWRHYGG